MSVDLESMDLVLAGEALAPPLTGIGQYTRALVQSFVEDYGLQTRLKVFDGLRLRPAPACLKTVARAPARGKSRLRGALRSVPGAYELRQSLRSALFYSQARGVALYHEPNFVLKPFDGPCITTIHDLSHLVHPDFHPAERVRYLARMLPTSLQKAARILAVSRFTRDELVRLFGIDAKKIITAPLAAGQRFRPLSPAEAAPILARHGLAWKGYLLTAATVEPRKNLAGLIRAFSQLPAALRRAFPLVFAGAPGWREEAFAQPLERLLAHGEARMLGYLPDDELPALMAGCRCFAYVSWYEGFGLPVLEAQACGATVVASNRSALPEIAGPACLLVAPDDPDAIAYALQQAIEDATLARIALSHGPHWAAQFSWQRTAGATLAAYRSALDGR